MTEIFIDSIHAIKPPIYKFPLTLWSSLLLFFSSFECVLRYTALFIKGAELNELLTGARLSISSLRECFIISRLLAFFGGRVAIYSSGSVCAPPPHIHSVHITLCEVWEQSWLVCHVGAPWRNSSVCIKAGWALQPKWSEKQIVMIKRASQTVSMWWVKLGNIGGDHLEEDNNKCWIWFERICLRAFVHP